MELYTLGLLRQEWVRRERADQLGSASEGASGGAICGGIDREGGSGWVEWVCAEESPKLEGSA